MKKLIVIFTTLSLLLCGCTESKPISVQTKTIFAMNTVMDLTVYTDDEELLSETIQCIGELEKKLSVTIPGSEIHTINTSGTCILSRDTKNLLTEALSICSSTNGAFDISIYPVVSAWGFTTGEYRIPDSTELEKMLNLVDYNAIVLESDIVSVPTGMQLDLGGVAKGYTGDIISDYLKEHGVTSALLNLGGNVQAIGSKPDGDDWRIAVQHPTNNDYLGVLSVSDCAVITSGGYERYFTGDDGKDYWHIIDPTTGYPADSGLISVTIIGKSGLVCDALSTALFVMGLDQAVEYWRTRNDFDAILVTDTAEVYITEGVSEHFELADSYAAMSLSVIER